MQLPSLNSLRTFTAVADTGSYSLAANQLNVTHAAVSQQVKSLEKRLGVALVERTGRGIQLTEDGVLLARELGIGFAAIERGVERLSRVAAGQPVRITMCPAFAVEWLMPRIAEFQRDNPEITLLLNPTSDLVEPRRGGMDVAIRYRDRRRPSPDVEPVLISDMIVTGTPSLVGGRDLSDPASLVALPWLQELGTNEVAEWFTYHGVIPDRPLTVYQMPGNLIMDAVRRGNGITYTARAFFREDLERRRVVALFSEPLFGLYCVHAPEETRISAVRCFLDWLMSKAETVSG
jgi:LysR family glycine cleavage system transcriptional activator